VRRGVVTEGWQGALILQQKSSDGILVRQRMKARTAIVKSSARLSWTAMRQPIHFAGTCRGKIG